MKLRQFEVRFVTIFSMVLTTTFFGGCGHTPPKPKNQLPTTPVTGTIHINGEAMAGVRVFAFRSDKPDSFYDTEVDASPAGGQVALSSTGGKFQFTTYTVGDGLPEGEYVFAFYWDGGGAEVLGSDERKISPAARTFAKKYGNPKKSDIKCTCKKGTPVDLGVLDLKTK